MAASPVQKEAPCGCSESQLPADSVEKLVVFDRLMLVITLISFGCS